MSETNSVHLLRLNDKSFTHNQGEHTTAQALKRASSERPFYVYKIGTQLNVNVVMFAA